MFYDKEWYNSLNKPSFQPNPKLFPIVWTVLYIMMTISFFTVIFSPINIFKIVAIMIFLIQLGINVIWTDVFFRDKNLKRAYELSIYLFVYVFITVILFYKVSFIAAILLLPYLLWCLFAIVLAYNIYKLNTYPDVE